MVLPHRYVFIEAFITPIEILTDDGSFNDGSFNKTITCLQKGNT